MASFDFAPLTRRYAQDERGMNPPTVRPERSEAKSKDAKRCINYPTVRPEPFDKLRTGVAKRSRRTPSCSAAIDQSSLV